MQNAIAIGNNSPNQANRETRCNFLFAGFAAILLALVHGIGWAGPVEGNPRKGGTLILGMAADPSTLNCGIESSQIVAIVTSNIYNGLIHMDEESNPHPDLAQSWDISPDGLVYSFQLRDDDAEPFARRATRRAD